MTVSRLPNARYRDVILRLDLETARILSMAAARENVDPEIIASRAIAMMLSPDGRTKSERQRAQASEAAEQLKKHHRSLGLTNKDGLVQLSGATDTEAAIESEIARLTSLIAEGG